MFSCTLELLLLHVVRAILGMRGWSVLITNSNYSLAGGSSWLLIIVLIIPRVVMLAEKRRYSQDHHRRCNEARRSASPRGITIRSVGGG